MMEASVKEAIKGMSQTDLQELVTFASAWRGAAVTSGIKETPGAYEAVRDIVLDNPDEIETPGALATNIVSAAITLANMLRDMPLAVERLMRFFLGEAAPGSEGDDTDGNDA